MVVPPPPPGLHVRRAGRPASIGGDAPTVVFVHGSMDRSAAFLRAAGRLEDLPSVVYDRRGYGRSRAVAPPATRLDDHAADALAVAGPGAAVLVGHSYGGCVALRATEMAARPAGDADGGAAVTVVAAVVFESPLPWLPGWPTGTGGSRSLQAPTPEDAAEGFLRRMLGDERWDALPERSKADRRAEGVALQADMRSIRPGPGEPAPVDLASWAALGVPLVVGRGSLSSEHLRTGAKTLAEMGRGELVDLDGAGHGAHASHPGPFAALVRRALALAG